MASECPLRKWSEGTSLAGEARGWEACMAPRQRGLEGLEKEQGVASPPPGGIGDHQAAVRAYELGCLCPIPVPGHSWFCQSPRPQSLGAACTVFVPMSVGWRGETQQGCAQGSQGGTCSSVPTSALCSPAAPAHGSAWGRRCSKRSSALSLNPG